MRTALRFMTAVALAALFGCTKPLPDDKASYAGDWRAPGMRLMIAPEGRIEYERTGSGGNKSIKAPITKFEGDDFYAGVGPLSTRFVVLRPPARINGVWKMTVDGVELTRWP